LWETLSFVPIVQTSFAERKNFCRIFVQRPPEFAIVTSRELNFAMEIFQEGMLIVSSRLAHEQACLQEDVGGDFWFCDMFMQ